MAYYGVRVGKIIGVFTDWKECYKLSVGGFPSAVYRKFPTREQAEAWVAGKDTETVFAEEAVKCMKATSETDTDNKTAIGYTAGTADGNGKIVGYGGIFIYNDNVTRISGCDSFYLVDTTYNSVKRTPGFFGEIISAMKLVSMCIRNGVHKCIIRYSYAGVESWATGKWKANNSFSSLYARFMQDATKKLSIVYEHVMVKKDRFSSEASNLALSAICKNHRCNYTEFLNSCALSLR